MAKIYKNKKNLLIIEITAKEAIEIWNEYNNPHLCDFCGFGLTTKGYYVATINSLLCEDCFKKWWKKLLPRYENTSFEKIHYKNTVERLVRAGLWEQ